MAPPVEEFLGDDRTTNVQGWQSAAPRPGMGTVRCGCAAKCQRSRRGRQQQALPAIATAPRVELAGAPPRT
eukprot:15447810-Alexandrium_andersonii.AAC.1